jgi:plastocyanin
MRRIATLCIGAVACAAAAAGPASAQVQPAGTGEPAFTNSAQNTQWFEWPASSGADAYRIRYDYYENNALRTSPVVNAPNASSGSSWANWSGVATLQHGAQYGICAQGQYSFPNDSLFFPDGPNSCSMGTMLGRRAYTTIDRSKPTASVQLATGAAFVKDTKIPLRIDFADDVAGPFPANFLCFEIGGGPTNLCDASAGKIYGYNAACSVPGSAGKSTTFSCTADYGAIPDGTVWACVRAADAAIPDNPNGANQTGTADKANLSDPSCDGVTVDRTAPTVAIGVASAAVNVGELVTFQATASDATSGLAGAGTWTWGDNTASANGDAVSHTYTQPGTYEVALTVTDKAGNTATARKAITVTAPATGGGPSPAPPTPPTPPAGDDDEDEAEPPSIELEAPRSARARAKSIPVELTASDSGRVQLMLMRGSRVIARANVKLATDGTADYRLRLPRNTKAGRYTLKATYRTASASRRLKLTGKVSARSSARPGAAVGAGPRALPDGRFHGDPAAGTFKVI